MHFIKKKLQNFEFDDNNNLFFVLVGKNSMRIVKVNGHIEYFQQDWKEKCEKCTFFFLP